MSEWIPLEEVPRDEVQLQWPEHALSNRSQYADNIQVRGAKKEKDSWVVRVIVSTGKVPVRVTRTLSKTFSNRFFTQLPIHLGAAYNRDVYLEDQPE